MKPVRARYAKIDRLVRDLLDKHNVASPPVPVEKIADGEGAEIAVKQFNGEISGLLLRADGRAIIAVDRRQAPARQRFTIAHELGHLLLHEGKEVRVDTNFRVNLRSPISSTAEDVEEIEANAFASALLMPEQFLRADLENLVLDMEDDKQLKMLAKRYQVSTQAITFRLINLHSLGKI